MPVNATWCSMNYLEQFSTIECRKNKSPTNNSALSQKTQNNPLVQTQLEAVTCSRQKARGNLRERFSFTYDWLSLEKVVQVFLSHIVQASDSKRPILSTLK